MPKKVDPRLAEFKKLPKGTPWPERAELIRKRFPQVAKLDWSKTLEEREDIFAAIIRDILREEFIVPGKSGPRPGLEWATGSESLKQLAGEDFCHLPFKDALKALMQERSYRQVAKLSGLSPSAVYRLSTGKIEPDLYSMEALAKAFKKHPSWFAEYRAAYVLTHLEHRLMQASESTLGFYQRIRDMAADQ